MIKQGKRRFTRLSTDIFIFFKYIYITIIIIFRKVDQSKGEENIINCFVKYTEMMLVEEAMTVNTETQQTKTLYCLCLFHTLQPLTLWRQISRFGVCGHFD